MVFYSYFLLTKREMGNKKRLSFWDSLDFLIANGEEICVI